MDIYTFLFLIFVVAPAGTTVHELGHVLGAKSVEADQVFLSIGAGTTVYRTKWKHIHMTMRILFFIGGLTSSKRKVPYQRHEQIRIAALGPFSSFLAAVLCYALYTVYPNNYLMLLLLFNLWVAVVNIIPFRFKGKPSDGYTILSVIRQK
ncbi:site-2 protease family protein [Lentibacillus salicampi]|uniref:Peptidase M50 domain-containing protein n=1 Tax=Lentibacillus salicampi TaxID=175306 RepID=A0A4Y9AD10_9BACI|nr:site-2 protease family protein [Lentibacillus salicampi]TFJ93769.1 hypothetical protein E4U82_05255 [Lentibacillus salicampi]